MRSELFSALTHREDLDWVVHSIVTRMAGRVIGVDQVGVTQAFILTLQHPALIASLAMNLPGRLQGLADVVIAVWGAAEHRGWSRHTRRCE